jgi:hypothetical protein
VSEDRFIELSEQATAMLLATSSDDQTRAAEAAMGAINEWLTDLAGRTK